jgi:hypothetical protein
LISRIKAALPIKTSKARAPIVPQSSANSMRSILFSACGLNLPANGFFVYRRRGRIPPLRFPRYKITSLRTSPERSEASFV